MAFGSNDGKTEEPTGKRLGEARSKGNVAHSPDLNNAVSLLTGFVLLYFMAMATYNGIYSITETTLGNLACKDFTPDIISNIIISQIYNSIKILLPILGGLMLVGLGVSYVQTGFLLNTETLKPNLQKLNFIANIKKLFSLQSFVKLLFSGVKLIIIGGVTFFFIKREYDNIINALHCDLLQIFGISATLMYGLALRISVVLFIISILDFFYQKWQYKKNLRMTKQEVKDERKQAEGDPQIKAKIRSVQLKMAIKRMMASVPTADVVVTNPTHFAVALKYDGAAMRAPTVVAKGADLVAKRIKEIAKKHHIPLVEDRYLAQTLYKTVEIGREIPQKLYYAVAKVLSYVYQLKGKNKKI